MAYINVFEKKKFISMLLKDNVLGVGWGRGVYINALYTDGIH